MADISINSSSLGSNLMQLLESSDIQPGTDTGYGICKALWEYHPLGGKLVEKPVRLALSKPRIITVDAQPKEMLVDAFEKEARSLGVTAHVRDTMFLKRCYGAAAIIYGAEGIPTTEPIDPWDLPNLRLYFNQLDPLNLAGSIVTNQNPNSPDFQKPKNYITAAGQPYHPSRSVTVFNGTPIYLSFQSSAFGFTGRSVFLRALYPMRSFIQSMVTDDLVTFKAGLIIAKQKPAGSIVNRAMQYAAGIKRGYLQQGTTGNVLSIDVDEEIHAIDLTNTNTAMTTARDNIIANIAAASDVPALLLKDEAFTQGFGEGTEDAKAIVQYINGLREEMNSLYEFFDNIVMHRAWNEEFFESVKNAYPDQYGKMSYKQAFYHWKNSFKAEWDTLMEEPESERVKVAETKLRGLTDVLKTLLPVVDPQNRAMVIQWAQDNINEMPDIFQSSLSLDSEAIADYEIPDEELKNLPRLDAYFASKKDSAVGGSNTYIDNFFSNHRHDARADDFKEHEHPRDNSGKFTSGGGGGGLSSMTTSQLRTKGYDLAQERKYKEAAEHYRAALENYPEHHEGSQSALADKKKLESLAKRYESLANEPVENEAPAAEKPKAKKEPNKKEGYVDKHGFERSPNLTTEQRKIESSFYNAIRTNKAKLVEDYWTRMKSEDFPNTIDADAVKMLSPAFRKNRNLAGAVHEPSSYLSKVIYQQALDKKKAAGDKTPVVFTAGGSGSGKSATTPLAAGLLGVGQDGLIYDSVMSSFKSSSKKIDQALNSTDADAAIVYTNTPIERALRFNAGRERSVSLDVLIDAHVGASNTIRELSEHYKDNPRVKIQVVNNQGAPKNVHMGELGDIPKYDKAELRTKLEGIVKEMHSEGRISDAKLAVLLGK